MRKDLLLGMWTLTDRISLYSSLYSETFVRKPPLRLTLVVDEER